MNYPFSKIIKAGLLVGTLDILAAFLYFFSKTGNNPLFILRYIASALLGKEAYTGGNTMLMLGLLLHYAIAFSFTLFFFWLFDKLKLYAKNRLLTGIIYGAFIWVVMNLLIVPASKIPDQPFNWLNAFINMIILIACIGIPLAFLAKHYYKVERNLLAAP